MRLRVWILVVLVLLLLIVVGLDVFTGRADPSSSSLSVLVTPSSVDRFATYGLIVIAPRNSTFNLTLYGENGFHLDLSNRSDANGLWRAQLQAYYPYGSYRLVLDDGNATTFADLTVVCGGQCVQGQLDQNRQDLEGLMASYLGAYGTYLLAGVFGIEFLHYATVFYDRAKRARREFTYTDRDSAYSFFAKIRLFRQPGDQVADPRNIQNPWIADDMERREQMEVLHDATSHKYLEYDPEHVQVLKRIVRRIESATSRQKLQMAERIPTAKTYEPPAPVARGSQIIPDGVYRDFHAQREAESSSSTRTRPRTSSSSDSKRNSRVGDEMERMERWVKNEWKREGRARIGGWILFGSGAVLLFMAALVLAAENGIYVDPLRALWIAWPGDPAKIVIGILGGCSLIAIAGLSKIRSMLLEEQA